VKYVVKSKRNIDRMDDTELLAEILTIRGVEHPMEMLNLTSRVLHDGYELRNMAMGLDLFDWHIKHDSNIHIIIDSDVDGLTSASMMWFYIKELTGKEPTFDTHDGKQHGLYEDIVERIPEDTNLLIMPDASSSDYEWHKHLKDKGIDVLVLDHHNFAKDSEHAVVINNQDGMYPNPHLTGVGVVFKFLDLYDEEYGHELARNHLGLLGLGQIADLADVRDLETRFLILESLKYLRQDSALLEEIVRANSFSIQDNITITSVGWYVAPLINACFRQGSLEDRLDMFKAMCNFEEERKYVPQRKTKDNPNKSPIIETLQENVVRRLKTLKGQQDKETKQEAEKVEQLIVEQGVGNDKIIILDVTGVLNPTHTGLTANTLAKRYQRPVLLLNHAKEESDTYGGSGRNYDKFAIDNLAELLHSSGLIECMGHDNSFGLTLPLDNLDPLRTWIDKELEKVSIEPIYHVDFEIPVHKLKDKHIRKVGQWQDMFGGKCMEAPLFAITGVVIDSVNINRNKTLVKFTVEKNGEYITFVKKFASEEWYNELIHESKGRGVSRSGEAGNKKLELTILGRFTINTWEGKEYTQVEIIEAESRLAQEARRRKRF
jgi:single-stranded-DNA-specific exonuclease